MRANILLVEDNVDDVELVREAFRGIKGSFDLDVASNGEDALIFLKNGDPKHDLILLDLNMPRMGGIEMLQELRKVEGILGITPVVILTNSHSTEDVSRAYRAGANAYVRKPLGIEALADRILEITNFWMKTTTRPKAPSFGRTSVPPSGC